VSVEHATFEEWWEPFTFGVGPAGVYAASLPSAAPRALPLPCRRRAVRAARGGVGRARARGLAKPRLGPRVSRRARRLSRSLEEDLRGFDEIPRRRAALVDLRRRPRSRP
jgi:hypothetical protein